MGIINRFLSLLYPTRCPFCGKVLESWESGLCTACQHSLPWFEGCVGQVDFCDACFAPLHYNGGVRRAVHRLKFNYGSIHAAIMGELMSQCLHDRWDKPVDLIVWVPLSKKHLHKRGYDQAELLARRVSELQNIPAVPALTKPRNTQTQSRLKHPSARRANVLGAYTVVDGVDLTGKHVVLVDDVTTSGATLSECASCLRMAGAASVVGLVFAKAG